jgi:hypothetical protein
MTGCGSVITPAACAALALSGCAGSEHDLYAGERTAADVLPEDVAVENDEWDPSTARLPASHDGYEFYVFASTTGDDCLMTYDTQPPKDWVVGCLSAGPLATGGPAGVRTTSDQRGLPEETPAGWTRLTPELDVTGT